MKLKLMIALSTLTLLVGCELRQREYTECHKYDARVLSNTNRNVRVGIEEFDIVKEFNYNSSSTLATKLVGDNVVVRICKSYYGDELVATFIHSAYEY